MATGRPWTTIALQRSDALSRNGDQPSIQIAHERGRSAEYRHPYTFTRIVDGVVVEITIRVMRKLDLV